MLKRKKKKFFSAQYNVEEVFKRKKNYFQLNT
jgi:hypothetical protein